MNRRNRTKHHLLVAAAIMAVTSPHAWADPEDQGHAADSTRIQPGSSNEASAPHGLVSPAAPTIDSIDGTGVRRLSVEPGTRSIDGTGLRLQGQDGTDSIDGTGRALSTPADNLADSGQQLRTLDVDLPASNDCSGDVGLTASNDCGNDTVDGE